MLARLCQLKTLLILLLLSGCGLWSKEKKLTADEELMSLIRDRKAEKTQPEYDWQTLSGESQVNLFFDVQNNFNQDGLMVNVITLNSANNDYYYQLDLQSGQRYFDHEWCPSKDAWRKYSGTLRKPPFTVGVIPGVLDLLGGPQKVIIFGGESKFKALMDQNYFQVQLLGSVVQQICVEGTCSGKTNWPSRLIFIAVDPEDSKFGKVKNIKDLKEKIDFPEIKAYIENLEGVNSLGTNQFPTGSIGDFLDFEPTFNFQKKYSVSISEQDRSKMVKSCQAIYELAWREVGAKTVFDSPAATIEELREKLKVRQELKKSKISVDFHERFRDFTKKHYNHFVTCSKFVRYPSVNTVPEKFWFLSDIGIFYQLHAEGHYFDCARKSWGRNTLNNQGELIYSLKEDVANCSTKDIDFAFNYLPSYLLGLKNSQKFYYKFVDYDSNSHGTHSKIYSWIKFRKFESSCDSKINSQVLEKTQVSPVDHKWSPRDFNEGKNNDLDVIL